VPRGEAAKDTSTESKKKKKQRKANKEHNRTVAPKYRRNNIEWNQLRKGLDIKFHQAQCIDSHGYSINHAM
jgi:hypothetical protein